MKVITEERLRQMYSTSSMPNATSVINTILAECQELDQLTVTRLRPMSELVDSDSGICDKVDCS